MPIRYVETRAKSAFLASSYYFRIKQIRPIDAKKSKFRGSYSIGLKF